MANRRKAKPSWPPVEILKRAVQVDDVGKIPFVDTTAAARYLALSPHSLECYRSLGGGPPFYKFGKFVRYAISDLEAWVADRRHDTTPRTTARMLADGSATRSAPIKAHSLIE